MAQSFDAWKKNKSSGGGNTQSASGSNSGGTQSFDSWKKNRSAQYDDTFDRYVNSFNKDVNNFFRMAERDNNEKNHFNAADFFEERKREAVSLKSRAANIAQYLDDHMDSYTQESYDSMKQYLSSFNTSVDDALSYYQPSIDARTGMRAYEDELIAAMERNEQLSRLDRMVDYAFDPGSPSANFMQAFRQYQNDESYRAVTDKWTDEDRYTLGLLQQEDPAKAREFAIERNNYYNAQATDPLRKQIREQAPNNIWGNTGRALLAGMVGAGEIFDRVAETAARGQTTEKGYITPSDYAQETTGAISEHLNQKYGTVDTQNFQNLRAIGQQGLRDANVDPTYISGAGNALLDLARDVVDNKGVGDLYNFGYSMAQNLASRYTLGLVGGQPLVLANYFANAATSAIDDARRRGATGSQAMGIGLIKGALEVGTEFIPTSELFKMGPAVTIKDFLKSVGIEALEEFVGEGANALGGYIADKAIMGDLSEFETAKRKYMEEHGMTEEQAHAQAIKDAVTNIVSEGISGALSGAISGGVESGIKTGIDNQYYRNVDPRALIDEGMNTEQDSDAYRMAQQMQERIDNDQRVSNNQKRVLSYELRKLAEAKVAAEAAAEESTPQEQETKKPAEKPAVSKEGRSIQISTESPVDINDFAEIKNGKATIQLKDGGTVDYSDVSFATEAEANQYYAVSTLPGIETEAANDLLHTIQEAGAGQDDQSIIAVREAYRLGYAGAQASELANSDAAALSPDLRQKVFEIGQSQRRADAMAKPTVREAATKPTEGYKKVVIEGNISKPNKKTQKKWDSEIALMDYIADNFSGNAVHVYESYKGMDGRYYYRDSNGKVNRAPNGMYVNGEIWVDLRSGDNQEGLVLNTFAHEMYHHIERFDKAKAQELAEFVVKELGMESVDKAVEAQIQKARKAGLSEAYFMNVKGMTAEQARNEVYMQAMSDFVADSLETMFTRGDPAKAIADLKKENRTLFDQIKAFIDKWVSKLKDFYKDKTVSEEGAVVAQLKNFEQLQKLFMEGVQSAGENYRAAVESLTPGEAGEVFNEDGDHVAMSTEDEIQRTLPKTEAEIGEEQVSQANRDLEAFSLRNEKAAGRQIERLNDKLKAQKQESRDRLKSYKAEQKELIKDMQQEQRVIREELTGKASDVTLMEKEFIRLVKQYEKLDAKTGKKSIKDTKTIVELKAALKAEAKSHREDSKIWERDFNRLMRDYETAGRQIERLEATILRQRATAKARVEGRRKTEMRHKIQRKADELNRLLTHGTKHRNIPENLQPAVADILNAINMEVRDGEQRRKTYEATIARYDRQIELATDPLVKEALIEKRDSYATKGDQFANNMAKLKEVYDQIRKDANTNVEIDDGLAGMLDTLFEKVGNTPLGQMTMEQLEAVNDVLNITKKTIVEANKLHQEGQRKGVEETSKNAMREIRTVGGGAKKTIEIAEAVKKFGWDNLKPVYVFEAIGSKVMTGLFNNLRKGEDTRARDLQEGRTFFQNQWQKHKGENWDKEKKWAFTSTSGKRFELDLMQIMSLYALSKRDQARDHLRVGGFSFDSQYKVKDEVKIGPIKFKADVKITDASAYNLSDETLGEIIGKLTAEQRAFVDEMQAYLSDTMAAKGNEISMQKYGIRLFKEKNYFPLRVSDQYMAKVREQQTRDRKLKNSGFTKETTPNAKNPVVLSSFLDVWAEHVDEMSLYHSFVLPLDDMSRVLNYHDAFMEENAAASVVEAIRTAYGEGATQYIDQLIRDINGGARADSMASTINKMISKARKAQTMASLSVAIQQPSSILRACAEIDGKYFLGRRVTEKMHDTTWEEIKKYAPIAIIKEKGGFDTNVGKSTVEYLTDTANHDGFGEKFKALFTDSKFRDDAMGRLPALMDEMSWGVIWNAVKREQADKHPNMDVKSDAFMKLVADRFADVIVKTQVYDSVFSRSGMMRSKDSDVKMVTAFMAEPTTTANMLAAAIFKAKRGEISKADAAKTVGAIVASLAANAALVSLVYAMRDDDEDKRYDEKYIKNFFSEFFDSLNPIGYIPILRDFQSMARGFDVERADMALFGDLLNAIQGLADEKRSAWEKTEAVIGSVGNLIGVPLKNIIRDGKGAFKTITIALDKESKDRSTNTGYYMAVRQGVREGLPRMPWKKVTEPNDKDEMILAIQRGDEEHLQRVFGRFENQQKAESALQSAIGEYYKNGKLTAEEAEELLTTNFDRDDDNEVYWLIDEWDYAKANGNTDGYAKYGKFLEGVESGDFQTEMERLMEHGAEVSGIRSQLTRKYRKKYLEDETAREDIRNKLRPVFEATGMYGDEIDEKFNDWDFEAEYGITYSAFKEEYKSGNVTETEMRAAMDFYGKLNYEIDEEIQDLKDDFSFEKKFGMTLSEMKDAYDHGDVTRNKMIEALVFTGKSRKDAQAEVSQRDIGNRLGIDYANLDDAYKAGDISRQTLYNSMIQNGATKQEADEAIIGYDWLKKHVKKYPELTISDAKKFTIRISDKQKEYTLTDYGVSIDTYIEYTKRRAECTGVDKDGDGQIDSGTLRDEIFRMIDSLPISSEAKDGLAQIGYGIKSIKKNAPWH